MFLHELGSSGGRFKQLRFHEGMNILLADKTMESSLKDSRSGAGKTSFIRILRYILGGSANDALKLEALKGHSFWADLDLTGAVTRVGRPVSPQARVKVVGISEGIREWHLKLSRLFGMPLDCAKPTVGQLFAQLARDSFIPPKACAAEPVWESGLRIGCFLGFSLEILSKAGEISALEKSQKSLKKAVVAGALGMAINEAELRACLAQIRQQRDQLQASISEFRVGAQYEMHQNEADRLSHKVRGLDDDGVALEQRKHDLEDAIRLEKPSTTTMQTVKQLNDLYQEVGVVLPDVATRCFGEVREFYASVVNNRSSSLEGKLKSVTQRLARIKEECASLDQQRSEVMRILEASMALEAFRETERKLAELDSQVAVTEQELELVQSLHDEGLHISNRKSEAEAALRAEIGEREKPLEESIDLFRQLGEEIYRDKNVSLLVETTNKGVLKVEPKVDGDASAGIQGVKTFLLGMICVTSAIYLRHAPRILVHDNQLFGSMDDRQVVSCLNIGARLANQTGFQYIVTMNSDRPTAAEREGFKRRGYPIKPTLTDVGEHDGLFGLRFEQPQNTYEPHHLAMQVPQRPPKTQAKLKGKFRFPAKRAKTERHLIKPPKPLRTAIITVVAVVVIVFLLPAAFWSCNWQNDRVGTGGKTRTVVQMEQDPLVAPEVAGLKRLKIEHSESAGLGMYNGNEITAWYRPPQGQTPMYLRRFIKLTRTQGFIHANPPDENSAVMEHPGTRQKFYLDIVSAENQSWQDPPDCGTICVLIESH